MHRLTERKPFAKYSYQSMNQEIYESRTPNDRVVNYAIKIAQDYDAQLVILNIIRADANLHNVNIPSHMIGMKEQAHSNFVKIIKK